MAASILQVWMYSIQDQAAGGCSVSPWLQLIRVRHLYCDVYFFCKGIYTCNCTMEDTKPAQWHLDCEWLKPLQGGICFNHYVVTQVTFWMMERCHFVFPWCVSHFRTEDCLKFSMIYITDRWFVAGTTGRTPAIDTVPPDGLQCNNSGGQLWLPAQNRTSLGCNYGRVPVP